jgi:hypothetical protein
MPLKVQPLAIHLPPRWSHSRALSVSLAAHARSVASRSAGDIAHPKKMPAIRTPSRIARLRCRLASAMDTAVIPCSLGCRPYDGAVPAEHDFGGAVQRQAHRTAASAGQEAMGRWPTSSEGITVHPRRGRTAPGRRDRRLRASHTSPVRLFEPASKHHSPRSCTCRRRVGRSC